MNILGFLVLVVGGVALWRFRSPMAFGLVVFACLGAAVYTSGYPRPRAFGFPETITVSAMQLVPDEAIYLWTLGDPPVSYEIPWSDNTARQLQELTQAAEDSGQAGITVNLAYGGDDIVVSEEVRRLSEKGDD